MPGSRKARKAGIRAQGLLLLGLGGNRLGDEFVRQLCEYLLEDSWIAGIQLQQNHVSLRAADMAEAMLKTNMSLCELHLQNEETAAQFVLQELPGCCRRGAERRR